MDHLDTHNQFPSTPDHLQFLWNVISNARPIRERSDHDRTLKMQTATRRATEATFRTRQE